MAKQKIIKKMDEIETRRFYLMMKDRWTCEDYATDNKLFAEWLELKNELAKIA